MQITNSLNIVSGPHKDDHTTLLPHRVNCSCSIVCRKTERTYPRYSRQKQHHFFQVGVVLCLKTLAGPWLIYLTTDFGRANIIRP